MFFDLRLVDLDAQTGPAARPNDSALLFHGEALTDHVLPPRHVLMDRLADDVIRRRETEFQRRGGADRPLRIVRRHGDAVSFGHRRDPARFGSSRRNG